MANPRPNLYTIKVHVKKLKSLFTKKPFCAALNFTVAVKPHEGGGRAKKPDGGGDGVNLVVRPGDYLRFELGSSDINFGKSAPRLRVAWTSHGKRIWDSSPCGFDHACQVPPDAGFAGQRLSYRCELDCDKDLGLPSQELNERGHTVVCCDPDLFIDEC